MHRGICGTKHQESVQMVNSGMHVQDYPSFTLPKAHLQRCIDQATLIAGAEKRVFPSVYGYQFDHTSRGWDRIPGTCWPPSTPKFPNCDPNLPYFKWVLIFFRFHGADSSSTDATTETLHSSLAILTRAHHSVRRKT